MDHTSNHKRVNGERDTTMNSIVDWINSRLNKVNNIKRKRLECVEETTSSAKDGCIRKKN